MSGSSGRVFVPLVIAAMLAWSPAPFALAQTVNEGLDLNFNQCAAQGEPIDAIPDPGPQTISPRCAGIVKTNFQGVDAVTAMAIQPDSKILAAGKTDGKFALARYTPQGALDTTFGQGTGKVTPDFGPGADQATSIALLPNGNFVVAGTAEGNPGDSDFALARFKPDGSLDPSFGTGGLVRSDWGYQETLSAVAVQDDGRILAAGSASGEVDFSRPPRPYLGSFQIIRYKNNGDMDPTFGVNGIADSQHLRNEGIHSGLVVQPDGKIVAGATTGGSLHDGLADFALERFDSNGVIDPTFGQGGLTTADLGGSREGISTLVAQPDGMLVAAGKTCCRDESDFALARFDGLGALDGTFGTAGKVITDFGESDEAEAAALDPAGRPVAVGASCQDRLTSQPGCNLAIARYTPAGDPDSTFAPGGKRLTDFGHTNDTASAVAVSRSGSIIAGGSDSQDFALAAYLTAPISAGGPAFVSLAPPQSAGPVASDHEVTATVTDLNGVLVGGAKVRFEVFGANPSVTSTEKTTPEEGSAIGQASFTYKGVLPGEDTILAYADVSGDGRRQTGEPAATATRTWTAPASAQPSVSITGATAHEAQAAPFAPANFTLTLSHTVDEPIVIPYTTVDGTAKAATPGETPDYLRSRGQIVLQPGQKSITFGVRVLNDDLVEGNELFYLQMTKPLNATWEGNGMAAATIIDDDEGPEGSLLSSLIMNVLGLLGSVT